MPAHLTPLSLSHTILLPPHPTVILFYFGQILCHLLTYTTARKSISVTPADSKALKPPRLLSCTQPRVSEYPGAGCSQGSAPHLAGRLFLQWLFSSSTETPQSKAVTEAGATWPRAVPNVTKGILPRLSLRGLGNHLLAQNNSHICCSSASCSYLLSRFCSGLITSPIPGSCHVMQTLVKNWGLDTGGGWAPDQVYPELILPTILNSITQSK